MRLNSSQIKKLYKTNKILLATWFVIIIILVISFKVQVSGTDCKLLLMNPLSADYFSLMFDMSFAFTCHVIFVIALNLVFQWLKDHDEYKGLTAALFYEETSLWMMVALSFLCSCFTMIAYGKGWDTIFMGLIYVSILSGVYAYIRVLTIVIYDHPFYGDRCVCNEFKSLIDKGSGTVQITCAYVYSKLEKGRFDGECNRKVLEIIRKGLPVCGESKMRCISQLLLEIITMYVQRREKGTDNDFISLVSTILLEGVEPLCKQEETHAIQVWFDSIQKCIYDKLTNKESKEILQKVMNNMDKPLTDYLDKLCQECKEKQKCKKNQETFCEYKKYISELMMRTKNVIGCKSTENKIQSDGGLLRQNPMKSLEDDVALYM